MSDDQADATTGYGFPTDQPGVRRGDGSVKWTAYCRNEDCDWMETVDDAQVKMPRGYAQGLANMHEYRYHDTTHHHTAVECVSDDSYVGMRACGVCDDEESVETALTHIFEFHGWDVERQVTLGTHRADMIVGHSEYGTIGIELKYVTTGIGATMATAHHQIARRYRGQPYNGTPVDLWAFCPYMSEEAALTSGQMDRFRSFFQQSGIGIIDLGKLVLRIEFGQSMALQIPIGVEISRYERRQRRIEQGWKDQQLGYEDDYADDSEAVRAHVAERRRTFDYSEADRRATDG